MEDGALFIHLSAMTSDDRFSLILRRLDEIERKLARILQEARPSAIRYGVAIFRGRISGLHRFGARNIAPNSRCAVTQTTTRATIITGTQSVISPPIQTRTVEGSATGYNAGYSRKRWNSCLAVRMSTLDKMLGWFPHTSREWIELIIVTVLLWLLMMAMYELELV
jgi:hypothetical protein